MLTQNKFSSTYSPTDRTSPLSRALTRRFRCLCPYLLSAETFLTLNVPRHLLCYDFSGDGYLHDVDINGIKYTLDILDVGGGEEEGIEPAEVSKYIREYDGFIIVCAVNNRDGWDRVEAEFVHPIRAKDPTKPPALVVVANKSDLAAHLPGRMSTAELRAVAERLCRVDVPFFEVSAKMNSGVDQIFAEAAEQALKQHRTSPPLPLRTIGQL